MADISRLSNDDLRAISDGDMSKVSDYGLRVLSSDETAQPQSNTGISPEFQRKSAISQWRAEHPILAGVSDVATGVSGLMRGGANLISPGSGDKLFPRDTSPKNNGLTLLGSVVDPVGLAIGGGVGKVLPYTPMLGNGFAKGVQALGKNMFGGAVAGGAIGGLSEGGNATEGAIFGAGASALLPGILSAASKGAGWAIDLVKGRIADVKAGKVMRDVADKEMPALLAALKASGNDETAAQSAYKVGSTKFSALGERAAKNQSQDFYNISQRLAQDNEDQIAQLAGGYTQTLAKQATGQSKTNLQNLAIPIRNQELDVANIAGKLQPKLQGKADSLANAAASKVQDVRRFTAAEQRARDIANNTAPVDGMPRVAGKYTYMGEQGGLADRAAQVADKAAFDSNILGAGARFAQSQSDSLAAHGLKPIDTDGIMNKIFSLSNDVNLAGNKPASDVMNAVASDIAEWTAKNGGVIDAYALDAISRNSVKSAVARLLINEEPEAKQAAAAAAMTSLKPLFSEAIVNAGGTEYPAYLKTYEEGMKIINQQKLGAKALDMLQNSPDSFIELVKGNNPKLVQKLFTTEYDINSAMGQKFLKMQDVSDKIARDKKLKEMAQAGSSDLSGVLERDALKARLPPFIDKWFAATNKGLDVAENLLNKKVMAKVYNAMKNGKDAASLMQTLSTEEQSKVLQALQSGNLIPYLSSTATNVSQQGQQP